MNLSAHDPDSIQANAKELIKEHDQQTVEIIVSLAARSAFKMQNPEKQLPEYLQPGNVLNTIWGREKEWKNTERKSGLVK